METIAIAGTQQRTTRLGFGCSGIVGGLERRGSLALLECAFDAGIRHFDVAPMYGFGTAEEVLGEFLQRHRGEVTVTTKFGVLPERRHPVVRLAYKLGKRLLSSTRRGDRSAPAMASAIVAKPLRKVPFTADEAALSLNQSLRRLRVDSLDLLLLHEAAAEELQDSHLLTFLRAEVARERIRAFGVGSAPPLIPDLLIQAPAYCNVIQSEWSAADSPLQDSEHFRITHRALMGNWQRAYDELLRSRDQMTAWSDTAGVDLSEKAIWPRLLLRAAFAVNTGTVVLFSTRSPARIAENVAAAQDADLTLPSIRLHELLRGSKQTMDPDQCMAGSLQVSFTSGSVPHRPHDLSSNL